MLAGLPLKRSPNKFVFRGWFRKGAKAVFDCITQDHLKFATIMQPCGSSKRISQDVLFGCLVFSFKAQFLLTVPPTHTQTRALFVKQAEDM